MRKLIFTVPNFAISISFYEKKLADGVLHGPHPDDPDSAFLFTVPRAHGRKDTGVKAQLYTNRFPDLGLLPEDDDTVSLY